MKSHQAVIIWMFVTGWWVQLLFLFSCLYLY
jgi:hypothetical protein